MPSLDSAARRAAKRVGLVDGGVDHGVFHIRLVRAGLEKPDENAGFDPVTIPLEDAVPVCQTTLGNGAWPVTPRIL